MDNCSPDDMGRITNVYGDAYGADDCGEHLNNEVLSLRRQLEEQKKLTETVKSLAMREIERLRELVAAESGDHASSVQSLRERAKIVIASLTNKLRQSAEVNLILSRQYALLKTTNMDLETRLMNLGARETENRMTIVRLKDRITQLNAQKVSIEDRMQQLETRLTRALSRLSQFEEPSELDEHLCAATSTLKSEAMILNRRTADLQKKLKCSLLRLQKLLGTSSAEQRQLFEPVTGCDMKKDFALPMTSQSSKTPCKDNHQSLSNPFAGCATVITDMSLPSLWDAAPKFGSDKAISATKLHENENSGQIRTAERAHSNSLNGLTAEEDTSDIDQDIQALATVCVVVDQQESFVRAAGKPILHSPIVIRRRRKIVGAPLACFVNQVHAPRFSRHHPQMGLESVTLVHPIVYCESENCLRWEGTPTVTADSLIPSEALEVSPVTLVPSEYKRWDDGNGGSQPLIVDTQQGETEESDKRTSEGYHSAVSPDQDDPGAVHPTSVTPSIVTEPALMPPTKVCTESVQSSYPVHQPKFARISQAFRAMKRSRKERQSARELKQNATEGILAVANNLCSSDTDLSKAVELEHED